MENKIMVITGTRKGIGKELAEYYVKKDFIVIGCSRGVSAINHPNYFHFSIDISDEKSVKQTFKHISNTYGKIDILINNAGVNFAHSLVALVSYKSAEDTIKTNFLGTFLMSKEAIKLMMKNSFGRIINFGSMTVRHEDRGGAIYTASKAAINTFSKILSKEIFKYGITVNVISPSAIKTDLMDTLDSTFLNQLLLRNAINEIGTTSDLINVIDWLITNESRSITGQNIYLGGA
jgi:3-oxoacyl-[acyl-carrier protein] reductase